MKEWLIVATNGILMLGQTVETVRNGREENPPKRLTLEPVYQYNCQFQFAGRQINIARNATPLFTFSSLKRIEVPEGALVLRVADLSRDEQTSIEQCISACEQMLQAQRTAESGLILPGAMQ